MPESAAPILAAAVAVIGAALGYLFRGQIRGTTADKLWDVADRLRQEQAKEIEALRAENKNHEERLRELEKEASAAKALANQLQREKEWKEDLIQRQAAELSALRTEVAALRAR